MTPHEKTPAESSADVATFRRFNRMYTRFIGTLNEGLLNSEFNLAEARVLYELATRTAPKAAEIAADLEIDPGYLSRILARFERDELLRREVSEQDGRSTSLRLTARGKSAFKKLDALSETQTRAILDGIAPSASAEVIQCMRTIENILLSKNHRALPIVLRSHRVGDMGWVVHREGVGYAKQFGWDETFEALVAKIVHDFVSNFDPEREHCWIAEIDGQNVGHIFLVQHPAEPETAKLRLLFVEPSARGMGVGGALVKECISFARSAGYGKVVLWTQSILTDAHRIYRKAGFRLVKEEAHHSFGHDLIGQEWELEFNEYRNLPVAHLL